MESLQERCNHVDTETSDLDLMETTNEEIEARVMRLIRELHEDKTRKLDKEIATLS